MLHEAGKSGSCEADWHTIKAKYKSSPASGNTYNFICLFHSRVNLQSVSTSTRPSGHLYTL